MRFTILCALLCVVDLCQAQMDYDRYTPPVDYDYEYNPDQYKPKYPYAKNYTPAFLGLVVGANVLNPQQVELGLAYNFVDFRTTFGMTGGYQMVYKRSLVRDLNAVDVELGIYGLVSLGLGVNYSFSNEISAVGFKPIIGTSMYHFQLLYGYNVVRKEKRDWYDLSRHSLSIRYVLPLKSSKNTYYSLPAAPNYQNLPGLNENHPVKDPRPVYEKGYNGIYLR